MKLRIQDAIDLHNAREKARGGKKKVLKSNLGRLLWPTGDLDSTKPSNQMSKLIRGETAFIKAEWLDIICEECSVYGYPKIDWNFLRGLPSVNDDDFKKWIR